MNSMGLAAHDHRAIEGQLPEMLEIGFQPPWQLTIAADDQIVADRCDQHDFHSTPGNCMRLRHRIPL